MSALIAKNELVASKRTIDIQVFQDFAQAPAPDNTDFVALGILHVSSKTTPGDMVLGTGTIKNKRRGLAFVAFVFTASSATDQLTKVAHGLRTGDGAVSTSNVGGALPAPLAANTTYYVIKIDADNIKLATSLANAYAGVAIDLTTNGTGVQTLTAGNAGGAPAVICTRGIASWFTYTFTQAETNGTFDELAVIIDGPGYATDNNGGGMSSAGIVSAAADVWGTVMDTDGRTAGDIQRALGRGELDLYTEDGAGNFMHKKPDGTDSHGGQVTPSGRVSKNIVSLT